MRRFLHFFHWTIITTHSVHVSPYTQYSNSHTGLTTTTRTTLVFLLVTIQPVYLARDHLYIYIHSSVKQPLQWDCLSFSIYTSFFSLLSLIQGREVKREREGDKGIHHKDHHHQKTSVVLVL